MKRDVARLVLPSSVPLFIDIKSCDEYLVLCSRVMCARFTSVLFVSSKLIRDSAVFLQITSLNRENGRWQISDVNKLRDHRV